MEEEKEEENKNIYCPDRPTDRLCHEVLAVRSRNFSLMSCVCVCARHNSGGRSRRLWRATVIELFQTW